MTSANLDLVRSVYDDWERGDLSSTHWAHRDIEYVEHGGLSHAHLAPERFHGLAEMASAAREFVSAWEGWSIVADEMLELDDERVLVLTRYRARGKSSGIAVDQLGAHIFLVRDGKVAALTVYADRRRALLDVGLDQRAVSEELATSERNVELMRQSVALVNMREFPDELFDRLCTPDFEMRNPTTAVTEKAYRGADGVREWIADFGDAFGTDFRLELEEVVAQGSGVVVSKLRWDGHGSRSGARLVLKWFSVAWFRDGKMSRGVGYVDRREALEAAGLEA